MQQVPLVIFKRLVEACSDSSSFDSTLQVLPGRCARRSHSTHTRRSRSTHTRRPHSTQVLRMMGEAGHTADNDMVTPRHPRPTHAASHPTTSPALACRLLRQKPRQ